MPGPSPQLVALLLCDRAFQESGTRKWHISGVFDTIHTAELPSPAQPFSAFVALSDFAGDATVQLVIRDPRGDVVKGVRAKIPRIPLGLFQYVFPFPDVEFRGDGIHTLELLAAGDVIALRSFSVQNVAPNPDEEQQHVEGLVERYKDELAKDALDVWEKHPDAQPIGLIASARASAMPWFRQKFESLFGAPPPQMDFVGILDRPSTMRLIGEHADRAEQWLAGLEAPAGRVLPIVIAMQGGFHFTPHPIDPLA